MERDASFDLYGIRIPKGRWDRRHSLRGHAAGGRSGDHQYEFNGLRLLLGTGCTIEDLTELGTPKCILPELAKRYDDRQDCNTDENSIWQTVIDDYFNERGWKLP